MFRLKAAAQKLYGFIYILSSMFLSTHNSPNQTAILFEILKGFVILRIA